MDFCSRCTRSRLLSTGVLETATEIIILILCISSVSSQYGDFYTNLEALFSGSKVNPTPTTTKTPPLTPRPFVSLGQLLALDRPAETPKPKQTPAPPSLNPRVGLTRGTPPRASNTRTAPQSGSSPNDLFTMMNLNSWQDIPSNLFASSGSRSVASNGVAPTPQGGTKRGSSWQGVSFSDSGPSQSLGWDYSANGLDHGSNTGLESGNMVGGAAGGAQEPFLPLADHSPGSSMADQPGQMVDWSAPPVSKDTYKYDDEPTPKPKPPADGESMAKAILRGQVRRWQWNYSTTLLQGEISGRGYGGHYDNSVQCCARLPYICGVDGMCVIDKNECNEFCICASNPSMPHCIRDVIPRIKKTMAVLEKKILERVSIEMNLPVPVAIAQASLPLLETTVTTTSTTSTRRPVPFILTRKSTTTTTTSIKLSLRHETTPLKTTWKSPTVLSQSETNTQLRNQSSDITTRKMFSYDSPAPSASSTTTQKTTHLTAEIPGNYNRFISKPLASATNASPTAMSILGGLKTTQMKTEPSPPPTPTRRTTTSTTTTTPFGNPFQVTQPTITKLSETAPDAHMELRFLGTKNMVYKTTGTPSPKGSDVVLSTPKMTSFMDSMIGQPDGTVDGNTHNFASSLDNRQVGGMTYADSAFGMMEASAGHSDSSDPNRISSSHNLDPNVISTTSFSETTTKEATTKTTNEVSTLTAKVNSTLNTDTAVTSNLHLEKPTLVSSEQPLVSVSESGSMSENTSLQVSTVPNTRLDAHETKGVNTKITTAYSATPDESLATSEDSTLSSVKITTPSTEEHPTVSVNSTILGRFTSTVTTTAASTPDSELTSILSSTAASAPSSSPYTPSSTAARSPNSTYTASTSTMSLAKSPLTYTSSSASDILLNSTLTYTSSTTSARSQNSTLIYTTSSTYGISLPNSSVTDTTSSTAYSSPNSVPTDLSLSTSSQLHHQETLESVGSGGSTVRIDISSVDPSSTSDISADSTTPSYHQPNGTTGQLNTSITDAVTTTMVLIKTVRLQVDTTDLQTSVPGEDDSSLTATLTGDNTTTPISLFGSDYSSNVSFQNRSDSDSSSNSFQNRSDSDSSSNVSFLNRSNSDPSSIASFQNGSDSVDGAQEGDFLAWFNKNDSKKDNFQNTEPGMSSGPRKNSTDRVAMEPPCGYDCDKKGGRCLMAEDFKPHCVVNEGDPCDHFQCINGMCAPIDGVYACRCGEGWTGTFCEQPCSVDCGEHGMCGRVGDNMVGCICDFNYTGDRCGDKKKFRPTVTEITVPMDGLKAWEVAVVAVVTAVSLGLVCVLLPYILWRRQWLPIRQLVFYFQEYEDNGFLDVYPHEEFSR